MKGILLAGGTASRLFPVTRVVNKHLLPVYDKPMIYYPLSTLMLAGVRDVLVISSPRDVPLFREALGDGTQWGLRLSYEVQPEPQGIAQALVIASQFLAGEPCALILGDNVFFGHDMKRHLQDAVQRKEGATLFAYRVRDPQRYGVVEFGPTGAAVSLEEKPKAPKSDWAVTGIYFLDGRAPDFARELKPSARGEFEIMDLTRLYLERDALHVVKMGRGMAWLDTGTHDSLQEAAAFIKALEARQGLKVSCVEEIALSLGYIDAPQMRSLARELGPCDYSRYLLDVADHHERRD